MAPRGPVAVAPDDQVERVVLGDRAVEITGDEQLLHRAGGYQSRASRPRGARRTRIGAVGSRAIAVIGQGAPDEGAAADVARTVGRLLAQAGATVVTRASAA